LGDRKVALPVKTSESKLLGIMLSWRLMVNILYKWVGTGPVPGDSQDKNDWRLRVKGATG